MKQPGTHDSLEYHIESGKDFTDVGILYLYFSMHEIGGLTDLCISSLPTGVFSQLTQAPLEWSMSKRGKLTSGGKGCGGMGFRAALDSMAARNNAKEQHSRMETIALACKGMVEERGKKMKALDDLAGRLNGNKKNVKIVNNSDIDSDNESGGEDNQIALLNCRAS